MFHLASGFLLRDRRSRQRRQAGNLNCVYFNSGYMSASCNQVVNFILQVARVFVLKTCIMNEKVDALCLQYVFPHLHRHLSV